MSTDDFGADLPVKSPKPDIRGAEVIAHVAAVNAAQPVPRAVEASDAGGLADIVAIAENAIQRIVDAEGRGIEANPLEVKRWQAILSDAREDLAAEPKQEDDNSWSWLRSHKPEGDVLDAYILSAGTDTGGTGTDEERIERVRNAIWDYARAFPGPTMEERRAQIRRKAYGDESQKGTGDVWVRRDAT